MKFMARLPRSNSFSWGRIVCRRLENRSQVEAHHPLSHISSVPTLCEQNQLVIGNRLNFVTHRLCK
jgi:hypothetical protein